MGALGRAWTRLIFVGLTLVAAVALSAAPAAAYTVKSQMGLLGPYFATDAAETPGAKCGYSAPNSAGFARLRWMRVFKPTVYAADRSAELRDTRIVGWRIKLQRQAAGTTTWKTVANSAEQRARAYEDAAAPFTNMRVDYKARNDGSKYRALVLVSWYKSGTVEGRVKLTIDWYGVEWTVGSPTFVYNLACDAAAD
jgi:hypothetical protein